MYLTKENLIEIERWLKRRAVKDSDFPLTNHVEGDDLFPILQNGENRTINVRDFAALVCKLFVPDGEDLTAVPGGQPFLVRLKDKRQDETRFTGLGRVFVRLRKPAMPKRSEPWMEEPAEPKPDLLGQETFKFKNTGYIIQYDHDLGGSTINMPSGCALLFAGGTLSNGTISLNDTGVFGLRRLSDMGKSVTCKGTFLKGQTMSFIDNGYTKKDGLYNNDNTELSEPELRMWNGTEWVKVSLNNEVEALEDRVDTAESDIDSLEERMTTAETDIDNLEKRMDDAEDDIEDLKESIDSGNSSIYANDLKYDSSTQTIYLYAKDGTTLATVDAASFVKDGMVSSMALVKDPEGYDAGVYLHVTFNSDAAKDDLYVNMSTLLECYTGGSGIKVSESYEISLDESYLSELLLDLVKYESDFDSGLTIGHLLIDNDSTTVTVPYASKTQYGVAQFGTGLSASDDGVISLDEDYITSLVGSSSGDYTLPAATASTLGGVMVGDGLDITTAGTLSLDDDYIESVVQTYINDNGTDYTLPAATSSTLGGVMIGDGIDVTSAGVISVDDDYIINLIEENTGSGDSDSSGSSSSVSISKNYTSGTAIFKLTIDGSSTTVYVPTATTSQLGLMKVGDGLDVSSGTVSVDASDVVSVSRSYSSGLSLGSITIDSTSTTFYVPYATTSQKGVVSISSGGGLSVSSGTLSIDDDYIISLIEENASSGSGSTVSVTRSYSSGTSICQITIDGSTTTIWVPSATATQPGLVKIGDGLNVSSSLISIDDDYIIDLIDANASCYWYKSGTNIYAGTSTTASYAAYATAFYESSDERLKENIVEVSAEDMEKVSKVGVKSFNFKEGDTRARFGVIAQELEGAGLGSLVSTNKDGYKSVDYTAFLALKIAQLEKENAGLRSRIERLEKAR